MLHTCLYYNNTGFMYSSANNSLMQPSPLEVVELYERKGCDNMEKKDEANKDQHSIAQEAMIQLVECVHEDAHRRLLPIWVDQRDIVHI